MLKFTKERYEGDALKELNHVRVVIDGDVHELTSEETTEHIQTVARYIDDKIKTIYKQKANGYLNPRNRTLLIALNIADDLFKERETITKIQKENKDLTESLEEYLDENTNLRGQNALLTERVEQLEKEIKEFTKNFPQGKTKTK